MQFFQQMKNVVCFLLLVLGASTGSAQTRIVVDAATADSLIAPEIYGQFAEHLGGCIYGGLWVGPDSKIPESEWFSVMQQTYQVEDLIKEYIAILDFGEKRRDQCFPGKCLTDRVIPG